MRKSELRKTIRERKRQFTQKQLDELSLSVITKLKEHKLFKSAKRVFLYYSLPDEVNTHELIRNLADKKIVLPKVIDDRNMILCEYNSPLDMTIGAFNIMEPTGNIFTDYDNIDIAIIPGMAFDKDGNRMGRGKGYYDRLLYLMPHVYKIGICFPFQLVDHVPTETTDIKMNEVISICENEVK